MTNPLRLFVAFVLTLSAVSVSAASRFTQEAYWIYDTRAGLPIVRQVPEIIVDHVHPTGFEVYGPRGLGAWLQRTGLRFTPLWESFAESVEYPSPEQIGESLRAMAAAYPQTARLFSIGKSKQGRELWVMKISHRVSVDDNRPEFKYVANMHGNEIVGRELMVRLIQDLLRNDGSDPAVTNLLETTQIYVMPSMNPDGAAGMRRGNADYVDLNRDFPDFSSRDANDPAGRAPETQAMMAWQATRHFTLSANFHGGAEVVNYPWDAIAEVHPMDGLVKNLSLEYAKNAPYIGKSTVFRNGITNGYAWYEVNGGMQDWSFAYHRDLQLTVELTNSKWPAYKMVDGYYAQNRAALLGLIARVHTLAPTTPMR